jgi:chemotaxis protein methyltransferase CheR
MNRAEESSVMKDMNDFSLSDEEFDLLRGLAYARAGIHLGPHKKELLRARLLKRVRALGCESFMEYYAYLRNFDHGGEERVRFINAITTNVTDFFREEHHFQYLQDQWLPSLRQRKPEARRLRIWSAGCSTGEEPYSIAMTVREALGPGANLWDVRILASDIDSDALQRAAEGVYPAERLERVPAHLRPRYFLKETGENASYICVRPELQQWITFRRISLMDDPWPIFTHFDAIFCRNVLIYFQRADQQRVLERLLTKLTPEGTLFLGHSEGIHGLNLGLVPKGPTTFQRGERPGNPPPPSGKGEERNPS